MTAYEGCTLPIGGFQKHSLTDYPGRISAAVFTRGCNMRCIYCHNPQLVYPELFVEPVLGMTELFAYLVKHHSMLDALVITGGEPTLHCGLPDFIRQVKDMGLEVKLDTNGTNPEMLAQLLEEDLLDYVAMDIKAPLNPQSYQLISGKSFTGDMVKKVCRSKDILNESSLHAEFRTTVVDGFHSPEMIREMAAELNRPQYIQNYRAVPGVTNPKLHPVEDMDRRFRGMEGVLLR